MSVLNTVSRETLDRLKLFEALTRKWTRTINLVSPATLDAFWDRHIVDSAQIWALRPVKASTWVDIGAGGGFPGLVIAALAAEQDPELKVTLVESDTRKCVFLRQTAREMGLSVTVETERVEKLTAPKADILSARALATVDQILNFSRKLTDLSTVFILPKGKTAHQELDVARESWSFECQTSPSETDPEALILRLSQVSRRS
ncbi:MAG: 16S rRNA (guanine(527)-N(7))-methyltransferase RsmG [Pseudomonadota bacterium]